MYFLDFITAQIALFLKENDDIVRQPIDIIKNRWNCFFKETKYADPNQTTCEFYTRMKMKKYGRLNFGDVYFNYVDNREIPDDDNQDFFKSLIYVASDLGSQMIGDLIGLRA